MEPWIDPKETDPAAWGGSADDQVSAPSVYERAHGAGMPYERREQVGLAGPDVAAAFDAADYDRAKLHYHVVDGEGRVKVLSKGHLWGDDDTHQRFRIQYRRPPEPTGTPPFDTYRAWVRFQTGTVSRAEGSVRFDPDADPTERALTLAWEELFATDRLRIAEAELVRNPPLARYVLSEQGGWADIRDAFRYHPAAFRPE